VCACACVHVCACGLPPLDKSGVCVGEICGCGCGCRCECGCVCVCACVSVCGLCTKESLFIFECALGACTKKICAEKLYSVSQSVLQCAVVCYSVLRCVTVCCSVLQS